MKKITGILLTVAMLATMLTVFALPAFAESVDVTSDAKKELNYNENSAYIHLDRGSELKLNTYLFHDELTLSYATLIIGKNGALISQDMTFNTISDEDNQSAIILEKGGRIDVTLGGGTNEFCQLLEEGNIPYKQIGHRIIAGEALTEYLAANGTASILSDGSLTIICTVAAAVVFGLGGFFIGRKKKPALSDGGKNQNDD